MNEVSYFEDLELGATDVTPAMTLTETHAALYRGLMSEPADGSDAIPELLPLCLMTGLGWRVARPPLAVIAFMSIEWKMHRPLRVHDTIHGRARVALKRSMREAGVIVQEQDVVDQNGEVAQGGRFTFLVAKRSARAAAATPTG
jgi:hypothetical protein